MCYVCVRATVDGGRERGNQGCFEEDDGIGGAGGDVVYKEQVTIRYEELSEEVGGLKEEWKKYKEALEMCGRTSGKDGVSRSSNQGWWTSEVAEAVCEKKEAWKEIEKTKERGNQPDVRLIHTYGQKNLQNGPRQG